MDHLAPPAWQHVEGACRLIAAPPAPYKAGPCFKASKRSVRLARCRERVRALRRELKSRKLKGFLVPHSDEHQDEFLPPSAERLRWLTGFTGSAGAAIVLENAAALFVDGRYTLQARAQTDTSLFDVLQTPEAKASKWLAAALPKGGIIGYDPNLHTIKEIERLTESLGKVGITLAAAGRQSDRPLMAGPPCPAPPLRWSRMGPNSQAAAPRRRSPRCRRP